MLEHYSSFLYKPRYVEVMAEIKPFLWSMLLTSLQVSSVFRTHLQTDTLSLSLLLRVNSFLACHSNEAEIETLCVIAAQLMKDNEGKQEMGRDLVVECCTTILRYGPFMTYVPYSYRYRVIVSV